MINLDIWERREYFTIEEAACLWLGIDPSDISKVPYREIGEMVELIKEKIWLNVCNDKEPDNIESSTRFSRGEYKQALMDLRNPQNRGSFLYNRAINRDCFKNFGLYLTLLNKEIIKMAEYSPNWIYFNTEDENELKQWLNQITTFVIQEGEFLKKDLKLLSERKIIKNIPYRYAYVCFCDYIKDKNQLKEILERIGFSNIKEILEIWQKKQFNASEEVLDIWRKSRFSKSEIDADTALGQQGQSKLEQTQNKHEVNQAETPSPNSDLGFEYDKKHYTWIKHKGKKRRLKGNIRKIVKFTIKEMERGELEAPHELIKEKIGLPQSSKLRDSYKNSPLFKEGIIKSKDGLLSLHIE